MIEKAVLLIGSPRDGATTSGSLGEHFMGSLQVKGIETRSHVISRSSMTKDLYDELMHDIMSSDLVVLTYPLYIDSPPSEVIKWMERVRDDGSMDLEGISFLAIGHCDDPDPKMLDVAMSILHNFADSESMIWVGGLRMPMGPAIDGVPLKESGARGKKAMEALEIAAAALVKGEVVPEEAFVMMARTPMPELFYVMRTNRTWKKRAILKGTRMDLMDKPLSK